MRVTILTNGPGELWGWTRPVVTELRQRGHSVSLWLLPCPFASGHEREAASPLGVDKLEGPGNASNLWRAMAEERTDSVLQLGGDLMFGVRIARAAKAPLFCYTYGPKKGLKGAAKIFTAWGSQAVQIPNSQPIGDLAKDGLLMDGPAWTWPEEPGRARLLFLPGSRPAIRRAALPWVAAVAEALRARLPEIRMRTLFPPFIPEAELEEWRAAGLEPIRAGAGAAMKGADFALTQPGTNTLELMHCGLPSLVVAPASFLELVPVSGLRGMLASLPLVGKGLRRAAVQRVLNRWGGVVSLPNRLSERPVMDEMVGDITPVQVAERVVSTLGDPERLARTRAGLLALSGPSGAAGRLCDAITRDA